MQGIKNKQTAADMYNIIINLIPNEKYKEIVRSMYIDEMRDKKSLEELKGRIEEETGVTCESTDIPENAETQNINQEPDTENVEVLLNTAIVNEIESARFYRDLAETIGCTQTQFYDPICMVMNDDQNHAVLCTMLLIDNTPQYNNNQLNNN